MQPGITAGHRRELGEAGTGEAGIGEGPQGRAVIGSAGTTAAEGGERGARLWRKEDGVADEARSADRNALPVVLELGTIEHRILPFARTLNPAARMDSAYHQPVAPERPVLGEREAAE